MAWNGSGCWLAPFRSGIPEVGYQPVATAGQHHLLLLLLVTAGQHHLLLLLLLLLGHPVRTCSRTLLASVSACLHLERPWLYRYISVDR